MSEAAFNSRSRNIGELLGSNELAHIVVPTFQRGYSWEKKHVESFWRDIIEFQKENKVQGGPDKYFLGPIVTLSQSKDTILLLDGQQRLATATILFSVLRDSARSLSITAAADFAAYIQRDFIAKEDDGYSLVMGEMDELYFKETIQSDPPIDKKPDVRSHRNIKNARQLLVASVKLKIDGLEPKAALVVLKSLRQTLHRDLVMACIPVESERDAFRIFETLNDRGLRLSVPDLLLNYLMRVATPETDRKEIRLVWNEMLEEMGKRDINRFLRHLWVSKYGDLKSQDLFTALKDHIEDKTNLSSLEFTQGCAEECENYATLLNANVEHLANSAPYVRSLVQELDCQPSLPLLLSGYRFFKPADFEKIVKWLLVFATRYSTLANLDSSGLETIFFEMAREIRSKMNQTPPPQANASNPKHAQSAPDSSACLKYIKDTLKKNAPSDEQIEAVILKLILSPDDAKYVLKKLAQRMQTDTKEVAIDEANLEHIFPKNPAENEWGGKANQSELEPYLWHIGNLTILGERLNKSAANSEFSVKKSFYGKGSELEMARGIARDYTTWDKSTIEDRAGKLLPLILAVWNFDNPSRV
jgi:Protein of unknown function DUF262/Protein of unknown function (DUF1524)